MQLRILQVEIDRVVVAHAEDVKIRNRCSGCNLSIVVIMIFLPLLRDGLDLNRLVNTLVDILLQLEGHTVYNNLIKFKYKQYRQKSIQPWYELH